MYKGLQQWSVIQQSHIIVEKPTTSTFLQLIQFLVLEAAA